MALPKDAVRVPIGGACGCVALIDAADWELVSQFTWTCSHGKRSTPYATGYPLRERMHRLILGLVKGDGKHADHINGNGLDNRRENLRVVTRAQNLQNRTRRKATCQYRFKGVSQFHTKSTYTAYILSGPRRQRVSGFKTQEEAAMAYNVLARRIFGEFAALNQVEMG